MQTFGAIFFKLSFTVKACKLRMRSVAAKKFSTRFSKSKEVVTKKMHFCIKKTGRDSTLFNKKHYFAARTDSYNFQISMEKVKVQIEYMLSSVSGAILWNAISTPMGLEQWFADRVTLKDHIFTFQWGKTEIRSAEVINSRLGSFIRLRWCDETDSKYYFELRISSNELTNDYMFEIIDFAEPGEEEDLRELWDSQFETLRRNCGV